MGLFIRNDMLGDMTRLEQISVQAIGVAACFVWAFGLGLLMYFMTDKLLGGVRVSEEDERIGLNVTEHGATSTLLELANNMDQLTRSGNFEDHKGINVDQGTEAGDLALIFNKLIGRIREALAESKRQQMIAKEMLAESEKQRELAEEADRNLQKNRQEAEKRRKSYIDNAGSLVGSVIEKTEVIQHSMTDTGQVTGEMYRSSHQLVETLSEMLNSLSGVFDKMHEVDEVSGNATRTTASARHTINELKDITKDISTMISFINDLAENTHVLSVNSAIEAARAHEAGKGFSVISKEVATLSDQTSKTAGDIEEKVRGIGERVANVVSSMDHITAIVEQIGHLNKEMLKIIEQNESYTKLLESQSHENIQVVENVNNNMKKMADEVSSVARIGADVKTGLNKLSED